MQAKSLKELAASLAFDYNNIRNSTARIALAMLNDTLHKDISFNAYSDLLNFGPKNDWDGTRSSAERISREWEEKVLTPSIILFRQLRANREARQS
jgi:hypothetical protein